MTIHPFHNVDRARQLINFAGMTYGENNNRPTDIDALFELRDRLYVIIEMKYAGNKMPLGQTMAVQRLCDDLTLVKPTLLIVANHRTPVNEMIDLAASEVNKFRFKRKWYIPEKKYTVRELVDKFVGKIVKDLVPPPVQNVEESAVDTKKI